MLALLAGVLLGLPARAEESASGRSKRPGRLVVGSKNFTESRLLGEMLALVLEERTGLTIEHRSALGGTLICHAALLEGEIDLYPEYTGTGWAVVLAREERASDALRTFLEVRRDYRRRFDVEWLAPFGFENSYALALRAEQAEALGLRRISDLVGRGSALRAGFSIEFVQREDGWLGLAPFYDLALGEVRALEHGLAYEAIASGALDLIDAYTTDGKLLRYGLRVLEDDRRFFPPYHAAPIVRAETLRAHPELREALAGLAFSLDDETMTRLNFAVEEEGRGFREVAGEFLAARGLLEGGAPRAREPGAGRRATFPAFFLARWRTTARLAWEHLVLSALAVALATALALPLGLATSRSKLLERLLLGGAGVIQTIPSLALLAFLIAIPGLGLSVRSAILALVAYAILPVLRNTHAGIRGVAPELVDAARGLGLSEGQLLLRIELPLAARTILAGVRTAAVIGIGVATLAAFIGAGGLGEPIVTGLYLNDVRLILSGALPAAALALLADFALGRLERLLTPRGLRLAR